MSGFQVDPPVVAKAGAEFTLKASELTCLVNAFTGAAQIPSSAIGAIGPGQSALKAYNDLLNHVTEHLHNLQKAVDQTGTNLSQTARNYTAMEHANTLPGS
ncbi:MAG: hypothetical protein ABJA34_03210 [Pseudonocardiales bacterium]